MTKYISCLFFLLFVNFKISAQPGSNDITFNTYSPCLPLAGVVGTTQTIFVQSDGKILVGGNFDYFDGVVRTDIARLNEDGSLDLTFDPGTGFLGSVHCMAEQADGKIIIGGDFTSYNGTPASRIVRVNTDGSIDPTFVYGTGFLGQVRSIAIQTDNKIIIGGFFNQYQGVNHNRIIRLNPDGSTDFTFDTGTGCSNIVHSVVIQPDGKILVGGDFTFYDGVAHARLVRLNSDGTADPSFNVGSGPSSIVKCINLQADGKIFISGHFVTYNGTSRLRLARVNSNGSLDTSFDPGVSFNNFAYTSLVQADNKIIVGGPFTTYSGNVANSIVRLNTNGTIDPTFLMGVGFDQEVWTLAHHTNGKILVGGGFDTYNGDCRHGIARLNGDICDSDSTINQSVCNSFTLNGQTYSSSGTYTQVIPNSAGCDSTITINLTVDYVDLTVTQSGITLTSVETGLTFEWIDCNNLFTPLAGANLNEYTATTTGNFALKITNGGCIDTSLCFDITNQDFYDLPNYTSLLGEVFAFPVSTIDTCDAMANAYAAGGIPPYTYSWLTQPNFNDAETIDSLCEGFHSLKITDNIGDSVHVDFYVTDTANFFSWYDTTFSGYVDTNYVAASNCALDFSIPIDSASISQFYYVMADTIPPGDLYFIEITYYQSGNIYQHQDTISAETSGAYLLYFSAYCPFKSFNNIKTILLDFNYPNLLGMTPAVLTTSVKLYPNPTSGIFILESPIDVASIQVSDILGNIIIHTRIENQNTIIDLSEMSDGVYFVKVEKENVFFIEKLIKQ